MSCSSVNIVIPAQAGIQLGGRALHLCLDVLTTKVLMHFRPQQYDGLLLDSRLHGNDGFEADY